MIMYFTSILVGRESSHGYCPKGLLTYQIQCSSGWAPTCRMALPFAVVIDSMLLHKYIGTGMASLSFMYYYNCISTMHRILASSLDKRMAMFVIAGRADCPRFSRAEMLADQLAASMPHFRVHKASRHALI